MSSRGLIALTPDQGSREYSRSGPCIAAKAATHCPLWVKSRHASRLGSVRLPPKADIERHECMSALCHKRTHAPQQTRLFDYLVGKGDVGIVWAVFRLSTCSNLAARRSGSVAAEWRFGTEPADQVRRDLGNAAHAEQCHVAIHLILQQGKRALHARLASSHRREQ